MRVFCCETGRIAAFGINLRIGKVDWLRGKTTYFAFIEQLKAAIIVPQVGL